MNINLKVNKKIYIIVIIILVIIGYFIFKTIFPIDVYVIKSHNMEPTLNLNDKLFLKKSNTNYQYGDIIVFTYKNAEMISRIIGLPGEKLEINEGKVFINNSELDETYVSGKTYLNLVTILKNDEYFVMGDNREKSYDSRSFGPLMKEWIIGKVRKE